MELSRSFFLSLWGVPRGGEGQGKVDGGENETTPRSGLWIVKSNYLPLWRQANEDLADRCELVRVMIRERGEQRGDHSSRPCEQHSQSLFHRVQPHQLSVGGYWVSDSTPFLRSSRVAPLDCS